MKLIIFDIGGVIMPPEVERIGDLVAGFIGEEPADFERAALKYKSELTVGRIGLLEFYVRVLDDLGNNTAPEDAVRKHLELFRSLLEKPDRNVLALVKRLRKNYTVACLVNAEPDVVPIVRKSGLYGSFDNAYISTETGMQKPGARAFLHVLKDLDCRPEDAIFIDDKKENVDAARALGMSGILYKPGMNLEKELAKFL